MKIKNHYAWLCPIWIISTLFDIIFSVVNFANGKVGIGFIFLIFSVSFSFVAGILLNKAISIYWHNKEVEWLHDIVEELKEKKEEPFKEFIND